MGQPSQRLLDGLGGLPLLDRGARGGFAACRLYVTEGHQCCLRKAAVVAGYPCVVDSVASDVLQRHPGVGGPALGGGPLGIESVGSPHEFDEHLTLNVGGVEYVPSLRCLLYTSPSPRDGLLS